MNREPWARCYRANEDCANCYLYGPHVKWYGRSTMEKTDKFNRPIKKNVKGKYSIKGNRILATCSAMDFFLPEVGEWRKGTWVMIKKRTDIGFLILTKRVDRFLISSPSDRGDGYNSTDIGCTVKNQKLADERLPLFLSYPIKRRFIARAPLLEAIDLAPYPHGVGHVSVSEETGREARECNYDWTLDIREQHAKANMTFWFKNTGSPFRCDEELKKINPFRETGVVGGLGISILDRKRLF